MIPALALAVGVVLGLIFEPVVPLWLQPYLPIAVVAPSTRVRWDAGAAGGIFDPKVLVASFSSTSGGRANPVLGDKLGVGAQLSTGVVVVPASASSVTRPRSGGPLPGMSGEMSDSQPEDETRTEHESTNTPVR